MGQFRKKPVVVEAVEVVAALQAAANNWTGLPQWLRAAYDAGLIVFARDHVSIRTAEGTMMGRPGDWIIRGIAGELYPCAGPIFAATYEPVA